VLGRKIGQAEDIRHASDYDDLNKALRTSEKQILSLKFINI